MSGETQRVYHGTTVTLESAGAAVNSGAVGSADNSALDLSSYSDYPHARFTLMVSCASAFTVMGPIYLLARPLDIDSTNDAPVPTASYPHRRVGVFNVYNQTGAQYVECDCYDLPRNAEYYIFNQAGQQVAANWTLKANPFTFKPVP